MNARTRWLSLFSLLLCWVVPVAPLAAQDKVTVQAAFEPPTAKPGDAVTLVLTATVEEGWHAYGTREPVNIPVALKEKKLQLAGLELAGAAVVPPGDRHSTAIGDQFPLPNVFVVKQPLRVPAAMAPGEVELKGGLDYQVCDENSCLPPSTAKFTAKLTVAAGGGAPALGVKPGLQLEPDQKVALRGRFVPDVARAGETVKLVVEVVVDPRYHAYGTKEPTNLPVRLESGKLKLGGLQLDGEAQVPPGDRKEMLGVETFPLPHEFEVVQSLKVPAGQKPGNVVVEGLLDYQICDENTCDMPAEGAFRATLNVEAGAARPAAGGAPSGQSPAPAAGSPGTKPGLKVAPDEKIAIRASFEPAVARAGETVQLVLDVLVDERYHAYGTKEPTNTPVSLDGAKMRLGKLERVGDAEIPEGEKKQVLGLDSYPLPQAFQVRQALRVPVGTAPGEIEVQGRLDYQLCDENMCDEATDIEFGATLRVEAGAARAAEPAKVEPAADGNPADTGNPFGGSMLALILACIGGGLFALAMPCTYPMIPITFSFFTKQAEKRGGNVLPLALTYGFGIVLMFTLVGALLSTVIIDVVNHWITNAVIGAMFLFFAFVLFGWINLSPPQFLQNAAGKASRSGGYLGVFFMGATLVITSFTCTAPIVGSLLANVAQFGTGRVAFGMAIFGLTMALPFVVLSLMPTKVKQMPRSGEWMETLKVSLGFVELAAALKFVSMVDFAMGWQVLPRELFLLLWTAIFGMWAMYLFGILRKAGTANEGVGAGRMASGMFVTLLATYFLFGALGFKLDFYMTNFVPGYSAESVIARHGGGERGEGGHVLGKHRIVLDDEPKARQVALAEDKLLLYNFTGFN